MGGATLDRPPARAQGGPRARFRDLRPLPGPLRRPPPRREADAARAPPGALLIHRRRIEEAPEAGAARREFAGEYAEEHLGARAAARQGFIDEVIAPSDTRARLAAALTTLDAGHRVAAEHTNFPL